MFCSDVRTKTDDGILLSLPPYCTTMTQENRPSRKNLFNAVINQHVSVIEIKEITMAPGQAAPKHLHPCPVLGVVVSGCVLFQVEGEERQLLNEGDAFYETRNATILYFDNASTENPLTFIAFYLKEENEENIQLLA